MKLVVAVGGASGSIYAKRLLDVLAATPGDREVGLCFSKSGQEVWQHEIGDVPPYPFKRWSLNDFRAPFASGSAGWEAMVVIPCSTGGLARIAHGISDDLVGRAADVMLKERRKLVLVVREAPLSDIHLDNMLRLSRMGAVVLPPMPAFYNHPRTVDDIVDHTVSRVLDQFGVPVSGVERWSGEMGVGRD